ncbi:MAG: hypothetical protein WBM07_07605 [Chitinivibrionales bacterium]
MNTSIMYRCLCFAAIMVNALFADNRHCVMKFTVCPENFNNQTISVPYNVVGIAPSVLACQDTAYIESTSTASTSFFFIIDNSSSMTGTSGSDPTGARFNVTQALIDTIYKKQPNAQVGLAVFQEYLYFDTSTSSKFWYTQYFKTMSQVYDTLPGQAYMPLLTLNQSYNGILGINILDSALATTGSGSNIALKYAPNFSTERRTNINIAFLAAREAFANATAGKNNQYIVFLSDGDANRGASDPGQDGIYYFRDSTRNVPTTFTVFFNSGGSTAVPASIQTMTRNIQNNGYSASNPSSADFAINASYSSLSNVLISNVLSRINVPAVPIRMVLNNVTSTTYRDGQFVYQDTIRLGGTTTTQYTMLITYQYTNPSTGQTHDSTQTIVFSVRRDSTASTPAGIALACTTLVPPIFQTLNAAPAHNPVGPKNPIPSNSSISSFYHNVLQIAGVTGAINGALIGIRSKGAPLAPRTNGLSANISYGDAVVYDAVGNLVAKGLHVYQANTTTNTATADSTYSYGLYWDCHNLHGRWVGNGTYLLEISTTDANNAKKTTPIKIGVSR